MDGLFGEFDTSSTPTRSPMSQTPIKVHGEAFCGREGFVRSLISFDDLCSLSSFPVNLLFQVCYLSGNKVPWFDGRLGVCFREMYSLFRIS
jgi:hypothetical protein